MQGTVLDVKVADGDDVEAGRGHLHRRGDEDGERGRRAPRRRRADLAVAAGAPVTVGQAICVIEAPARSDASARAASGVARKCDVSSTAALGPAWPLACGRTRPVSDTGLPLASARPMDLYEYQGKQLFRQFGIPVSEGRARDDARGGARGCRGARRPDRRQGSGADRRPRQGGRRQARRGPGRRRAEGEGDHRPRHPRPRRREALDRAGVRHREGVLPLGHVRPGREEAALHVHDAGRRRDRGGRRERPRRARPAARRSARGLPAVGRAPARLRRRRRRPVGAEADRVDHREALPLLRRDATRC